MSLLLEALKKAERAKREADAPMPGNRAGGKEPAQDDMAFPEISLVDPVLPEPPPASIPAEPAAPDFTPPPSNFPPLAGGRVISPSPASGGGLGWGLGEKGGEASPHDAHNKLEAVLSLDFPEPPPPPLAPVPPAAAPAMEKPALAEAPRHQPDTPPAASTAINQAAAKKILAAKQGKPQRHLKLIGLTLVGAVLLGAVAAYYYWQTRLQPAVAFMPAGVAPRPAALPPAAPQPPATQSDVPPAEPAVVAKASPVEMDSLPPNSQKATPPEKTTVPAKPRKVSPPPAPANLAMEQPSLQLSPTGGEGIRPLSRSRERVRERDGAIPERPLEGKDSAPTGAPDSGIKIRRDTSDTQLDPLLASAYQAFMAGDAKKAENDYRKVLQQTPNSRDALLGLAAIAANHGQPQTAANHYLRVLQLDPKDAAAQAGLIGLRGFADPASSESRLKTLLAQTPDAGYLHFALGNLYAGQARWSEAQEAYFNAFHGDSGNADYAFNLAVSLEHLDQRKPALAYYQRALALVKERPAGFDSAQLKKRINELQPLN